MVSIVLADDHEIIRESLSLFLMQWNIETLSVASDGVEALTQYKKYHPDVVVLDLDMPKKGGLIAARDILNVDSSARIVVYSAYLNNAYINALKELGVLAFVHKGETRELKDAVECASRGEIYYCAACTHTIFKYAERIDEFKLLSLNEKIVALLLSCSMMLESIADALHVELVTVRTHKHNVFKKLKIHSLDELHAFNLGSILQNQLGRIHDD